jgi:hypothetical protein
MTPDESALPALVRDPLPEGFCRRVLRMAPGLEVGMDPRYPADTMVVVEQGTLELECQAGTRQRFGRGSMIPIAQLPVTRIRSVGPGTLVLVAVSRAPQQATDDFLRDGGSHVDC